MLDEHTLVDAQACGNRKPARVVGTDTCREQAVRLERRPESLVAIVIGKHARMALPVIRLRVDPVAPLEVHVLEYGNVAFRHRVKATQGPAQHVKNAKAPFRRIAVLHVDGHMRHHRREARKQVRLELARSGPAVTFVESLTQHNACGKVAELVEVQRIVKIVLEMEMASLVVPPALLEHEPIGGPIGDKRQRGNTCYLRHG